MNLSRRLDHKFLTLELYWNSQACLDLSGTEDLQEWLCVMILSALAKLSNLIALRLMQGL